MNIGEASKASGISAKMIRYYEKTALLPSPSRTRSGYRDYAEADVSRLQFVRRARDLGFPFEKVRALLKLWLSQERSCAVAKGLAVAQIDLLEIQVRELKSMITTLRHLTNACGKGEAGCPIIDDFATSRPSLGLPITAAAAE